MKSQGAPSSSERTSLSHIDQMEALTVHEKTSKRSCLNKVQKEGKWKNDNKRGLRIRQSERRVWKRRWSDGWREKKRKERMMRRDMWKQDGKMAGWGGSELRGREIRGRRGPSGEMTRKGGWSEAEQKKQKDGWKGKEENRTKILRQRGYPKERQRAEKVKRQKKEH